MEFPIFKLRTKTPQVFQANGEYQARGNIVTISIANQGTSTLVLWGTFTINAGDPPLLLGGDPHFIRDDTISIKFTGGGTNLAVVIADLNVGLKKTNLLDKEDC